MFPDRAPGPPASILTGMAWIDAEFPLATWMCPMSDDPFAMAPWSELELASAWMSRRVWMAQEPQRLERDEYQFPVQGGDGNAPDSLSRSSEPDSPTAPRYHSDMHAVSPNRATTLIVILAKLSIYDPSKPYCNPATSAVLRRVPRPLPPPSCKAVFIRRSAGCR
jgi:hypothetical protein